jgi:hypothetical protein
VLEKSGLDSFRRIELHVPVLHCKKNCSDDRPVLSSMKTERIFQGMKRPGRGANHSSASNIEINTACKSM